MDRPRLSRSHPDEQGFAKLKDARMTVTSGEMRTQDKGDADEHQVSQSPAAWPGRQPGPAWTFLGPPGLCGGSSLASVLRPSSLCDLDRDVCSACSHIQSRA